MRQLINAGIGLRQHYVYGLAAYCKYVPGVFSQYEDLLIELNQFQHWFCPRILTASPLLPTGRRGQGETTTNCSISGF
jgi:hypothetical protein